MQLLIDAIVGGIISVVLHDQAPKIDRCLYMNHPEYVYSEASFSSIPSCSKDNMRVVILSDTHDNHHRIAPLPPCDMLIHCGDVMMTSKHFSDKVSIKKLQLFNDWLEMCEATERIVIAGNHDTFMEKIGQKEVQSILTNARYLVNEHFTIGSLTAWATPLSMGKSPNRAFQSKQFKHSTITAKPETVDILVTHGQCEDLTSTIPHKIHIWGHSHNSYGIRYPGDKMLTQKQHYTSSALSICAPIMNGRFKMRNLPVIIDFPCDRMQLQEIPTSEQMKEHAYTYKSSRSAKILHTITKSTGSSSGTGSTCNGNVSSASAGRSKEYLEVTDKPHTDHKQSLTAGSLWKNWFGIQNKVIPIEHS